MKYLGSKSRFVKQILEIVLDGKEHNQWYVEPFAGGMNVICEVQGFRIANDVNHYLIELWKRLVAGWVPEPITRDEYYRVKENQSNYPDYYVGWVGFNCSYSGKWWGGFAGKTTTKIGTIRDYQDEAIRNVTRQAKKMSGVVFRSGQYFDLPIPHNSVVYCDPPYADTTGYADNLDGGFTSAQQKRSAQDLFWDWVRNITRLGNKVFVSEYKAPGDFECVWEQKAKSSLSANGRHGGNKVSTEKLFRLKER